MKSKNRYLQNIYTRQGSWVPSPHSAILTSSVGKIDIWVTPNTQLTSMDTTQNLTFFYYSSNFFTIQAY